MKINKISRDRSHEVTGLAVVIDVIRAFTTAAYAFQSGAKKMILVSTIEEALQIHKDHPQYKLMGESNGFPIEGFHFDNSPAKLVGKKFEADTFIFRTSSGTQGVVNCHQAQSILAASFVVAEATLRKIKQLNPDEVTFIITGMKNGDEDAALADYLTARLTQGDISPDPYLTRVKNSPSGLQTINHPESACCSLKDLEAVLHIDKFDFALEVKKENNQFILRKNTL